MDGNSWRPTQGEPSMDDGDWRTQLMPDSRQRIVNKIMETLKRHLPILGPEGLVALGKIAARFEEKIYTTATSQSDYLRKISLKMLTMETKSQGGVNNSLPSNPSGNQNPLDTGFFPSADEKKIQEEEEEEEEEEVEEEEEEEEEEGGDAAVLPPLAAGSETWFFPSANQKKIREEEEEEKEEGGDAAVLLPLATGFKTGLLPQVHNPGQSLQIPLGNQSQQWRQLLPQNLQNVIVSAAAQSTSMDSTPLTGHVGLGDWQEEIYQKIKSMKEMYLPELNELYEKIALKCQQHENLGTQSKLSDPMEKRKYFKGMLERMITFLQVPKNNISPTYKEKLAQYEKQIIGVLNSNRLKKPAPAQQLGQQQLQQSVGQSHSVTQQSQSQISQLRQHDNLVNSMPMNMQGSVTSMQSTSVSNLPHGSMALSTHMGMPATQQNMMNALQSNCNSESGAGHSMNSLPRCVIGSLQQNSINASQQNNMNQLHPNVSSLQSNYDKLQPQHLRQQQQEQQLMQSQQLMLQQYQQRHMLRLYLQHQQKQQILQQQFQLQQLHQQQKQQQSSQLQSQQVPQLHQMREANDLKVRPGATVKPGLFLQTHTQCPTPYHQQLKTNPHFPISSFQLLQASSSQLSQHSSPHIDQQNLPSALPKTGTPLRYASSPFIGTSPTPATPSLMQGDSVKQPPHIPSVSNAGNIGHQQTSHVPTQTKSLAIGAPGTLASPLLAEFTGLDGNQGTAPTKKSGKSSNAANLFLLLLLLLVFGMVMNYD